MKISKYSIGLCLVAFVLQGCGGGGSGDAGDSSSLTFDGSTTQATLTSDNVDNLSVAAASGAKQAIAADGATDLALKRSITGERLIQDIAVRITQASTQKLEGVAAKQVAARTEDLSEFLCDVSGSLLVTYPDSSTETNFEYDAVFTNCTMSTVDGSAVINGTMSGSYVEDANGLTQTVTWDNLNYKVISGTDVVLNETLNGSMTCTATDTVSFSDLTCDYYSDFTGFDDRVYRVTDVEITGDSSFGYSITATVYDPDYGYITISTEIPVTFNCPDGKPDAGRIVFEGSSGDTGSVDFTGCASFVVTYNGVADTFNW